MPQATGVWVPVLDGSGFERYQVEDGVLHREFKGVHDEVLAEHCKHLRNELSMGKNVEGGNVAFMFPPWLLTKIEKDHHLGDMSMGEKKRFWKRFESTNVGATYKVRGV